MQVDRNLAQDANVLADCSITITGKRPDDDDGTSCRNYQSTHLPTLPCHNYAISIASIQFLYTTRCT